MCLAYFNQHILRIIGMVVNCKVNVPKRIDLMNQKKKRPKKKYRQKVN